MLDFDRGMIKWQPFNSVVPSSRIIKELSEEKMKVDIPLFSDEQKQKIENQIIEAFYEQKPINVKYFFSGKILQEKSVIKKIDFPFHKIYFHNKTLLFEQIIEIN